MLSLILALGAVFILTAHASRPFAVAGLAPLFRGRIALPAVSGVS
jgi:hypothetical protein